MLVICCTSGGGGVGGLSQERSLIISNTSNGFSPPLSSSTVTPTGPSRSKASSVSTYMQCSSIILCSKCVSICIVCRIQLTKQQYCVTAGPLKQYSIMRMLQSQYRVMLATSCKAAESASCSTNQNSATMYQIQAQ